MCPVSATSIDDLSSKLKEEEIDGEKMELLSNAVLELVHTTHDALKLRGMNKVAANVTIGLAIQGDGKDGDGLDDIRGAINSPSYAASIIGEIKSGWEKIRKFIVEAMRSALRTIMYNWELVNEQDPVKKQELTDLREFDWYRNDQMKGVIKLPSMLQWNGGSYELGKDRYLRVVVSARDLALCKRVYGEEFFNKLLRDCMPDTVINEGDRDFVEAEGFGKIIEFLNYIHPFGEDFHKVARDIILSREGRLKVGEILGIFKDGGLEELMRDNLAKGFMSKLYYDVYPDKRELRGKFMSVLLNLSALSKSDSAKLYIAQLLNSDSDILAYAPDDFQVFVGLLEEFGEDAYKYAISIQGIDKLRVLKEYITKITNQFGEQEIPPLVKRLMFCIPAELGSDRTEYGQIMNGINDLLKLYDMDKLEAVANILKDNTKLKEFFEAGIFGIGPIRDFESLIKKIDFLSKIVELGYKNIAKCMLYSSEKFNFLNNKDSTYLDRLDKLIGANYAHIYEFTTNLLFVSHKVLEGYFNFLLTTEKVFDGSGLENYIKLANNIAQLHCNSLTIHDAIAVIIEKYPDRALSILEVISKLVDIANLDTLSLKTSYMDSLSNVVANIGPNVDSNKIHECCNYLLELHNSLLKNGAKHSDLMTYSEQAPYVALLMIHCSLNTGQIEKLFKLYKEIGFYGHRLGKCLSIFENLSKVNPNIVGYIVDNLTIPQNLATLIKDEWLNNDEFVSKLSLIMANFASTDSIGAMDNLLSTLVKYDNRERCAYIIQKIYEDLPRQTGNAEHTAANTGHTTGDNTEKNYYQRLRGIKGEQSCKAFCEEILRERSHAMAVR
ncbi:hypothetical protein Cyrtocomes_01043 [Candidatus Cyrtobacter comes]|uniref:Uncharacterized protein n=1 Tax=Candidatus Cyrtobacter comes TaxID=675776 RepID=A0ABU5L9D0_9RICK|nr:hypothetical protein [Candidatus Cyrtobacter comes]MDZ5762652.1 hypothetical protein [Candidatus Cyrtobacter comes]